MKSITLVVLLFLPTSVTDQAQQIAGAYKFGDMVMTATQLSTIVNRDPQSLRPLSAELQQRSLPGFLPLLIEARLAAVKNGQAVRLPDISVREMILAGPGLIDRIDTELASLRAAPVMRETPESLAAYHDAFWTLDTARNRIRELHATTAYWKEVTKRFPRRSLSRIPESIRGRITAASGAETHDQVEQLLYRLDRREMELRVSRLVLAVKVLEEQSELVPRILAAGSWREDQETLGRLLAARERRSSGKPELSNSELVTFVDEKGRAARELAGELTAKAESLNKALFWWVRGRYGIGTELFGLANPAGGAHSISQVIMPAERPNPRGVQTHRPNTAPQFARKHHYSWAVGPRHTSIALGQQMEQKPMRVLKGFR